MSPAQAAKERLERETERERLINERTAAENQASEEAARADANHAAHERVAAAKAAAEKQASEDLAGAVLAGEEAAFEAFRAAWTSAPANKRGQLSIIVHKASGLKRGAAFSKKGMVRRLGRLLTSLLFRHRDGLIGSRPSLAPLVTTLRCGLALDVSDSKCSFQACSFAVCCSRGCLAGPDQDR